MRWVKNFEVNLGVYHFKGVRFVPRYLSRIDLVDATMERKMNGGALCARKELLLACYACFCFAV